VINSGLLASLHSEDELVAILSHEIAHFVLDHSIQNLNEKIKRQERAAFWAGLATVATAVVEGVAAAKSDYYIPGYATIAVATLSTSIAESVNEQLGMEYNHAQENEADAIAVEILGLLNYDTSALSTALSRIEQVQTSERDYSMYLHTETHPALIDRIRSLGAPAVLNDTKYEQLVSFAVTNTAKLKYEEKRFCIYLYCIAYCRNNMDSR
jgi:predicted Zn-dependent protease